MYPTLIKTKINSLCTIFKYLISFTSLIGIWIFRFKFVFSLDYFSNQQNFLALRSFSYHCFTFLWLVLLIYLPKHDTWNKESYVCLGDKNNTQTTNQRNEKIATKKVTSTNSVSCSWNMTEKGMGFVLRSQWGLNTLVRNNFKATFISSIPYLSPCFSGFYSRKY